MSIQKRTVEDVPQLARLCETIPSDNNRDDWLADGKEVIIVSEQPLNEDGYQHLQTQWITTDEDSLVYLEDYQ